MTSSFSPSQLENHPPAITECAVGALIADRELREAFLGDIAEEFAAHSAQHGAIRAERWYRAQAVRSAPYLVARCWWPAPRTRFRSLGALLAGVTSGYVALQLLHQAAQALASLLMTYPDHGNAGAPSWSFVACSLGAGAGSAVLGGCLAGRTFPDAPLAAALTLAITCCVLGVAGMLINGGVTPLWYWVGLQMLLLPLGALLGGLVSAREQARRRTRLSNSVNSLQEGSAQ